MSLFYFEYVALGNLVNYWSMQDDKLVALLCFCYFLDEELSLLYTYIIHYYTQVFPDISGNTCAEENI